MNRIFLTGTTARTLRRLARHERGVTLERSSIDAIEPPSRSRSAPNRLDLARLRSFLSVSGTHGIELLVDGVLAAHVLVFDTVLALRSSNGKRKHRWGFAQMCCTSRQA